MGGDDEVWFGVFVDESTGGLQPLPAEVLGLKTVGDQTGRSRL